MRSTFQNSSKREPSFTVARPAAWLGLAATTLLASFAVAQPTPPQPDPALLSPRNFIRLQTGFQSNLLGNGAIISGVHDIDGTRSVYTSAGEVFLYDLTAKTVTQLTTTGGTAKPSPQIDGTKVVYVAPTGLGGVGDGVFIVDVTTMATTQVTTTLVPNGPQNATQPTISGDYVIFSARPRFSFSGTVGYEIYQYQISTATITRLTTDAGLDATGGLGVNDTFASIDGNLIAWQKVSLTGDSDIVMTTVGAAADTETVISNNLGNDQEPRVDAGRIVWYGNEGSAAGDLEIYLYEDGATTQVTTNDYDDIYPDASRNLLVWEARFAGTDTELVYVDLDVATMTPQQLTTDAVFDRHPRIDKGRISALVSTLADGAGMNAGVLYREFRQNRLTFDRTYNAVVVAYSYYGNFGQSSADAFYAYAYAQYAYNYSLYADTEFNANGSSDLYYSYRRSQVDSSFLAYYYAIVTAATVPGDTTAANSSIQENAIVYYYGLLDLQSR